MHIGQNKQLSSHRLSIDVLPNKEALKQPPITTHFSFRQINRGSRNCLPTIGRWVYNFMTSRIETRAYGVREGDAVSVMGQLLDGGADVHAQHSYSRTSISLYCFDSYIHIAKVLLDRGADVLMPDFQGWLPLRSATYDGAALVLELHLALEGSGMRRMIDEAASILQPTAQRCTVGQVDNIMLMSADMSRIDTEAKNSRGRTAVGGLQERHSQRHLGQSN